MKLYFLTLAMAMGTVIQAQTLSKIVNQAVRKIENKKIVALGEDTHGTAEFYALRTAITKKLIRKKGFTTFLLENPHEDMLQLQHDLQRVPLDTLMRRHLFPIYQTKQMRRFLSWFKNYSHHHPGLNMAGCDDSYRDILPSLMIKQAAIFNAQLLTELCNAFFERQVNGGGDDDMRAGLETYQLLNKIDSVYHLQSRRNEKLEQLIFHAKTAYVFYDKFARKEPVSRDEIMGERIAYHAGQPGKKKVVVWAHNGHIAKYAWLDDELGLMGATVLKKFPNDYIAIGMSSANGTYSYINNRFINGDHLYNDTLHTATFRPVKDSSVNAVLAARNSAAVILTAAELPDTVHPMRVQGYRKESTTYSEYHPVSPARLFDLLIFLRKTTATTGLFK